MGEKFTDRHMSYIYSDTMTEFSRKVDRQVDKGLYRHLYTGRQIEDFETERS